MWNFVGLLATLLLFHISAEEETPKSIYVGGWGDRRYVYEPSFLPVPATATIEHAHGIVIDDDGNVVITYKDKLDDSKCLLRWNATNYQKSAVFLGPGKALCRGVPHGLRTAIEENGQMVLYHANNEQALYKTTFEGDIIWSQTEKPITDTCSYRPTWFAAQPGSPFVHMADGYGSSKVFVYNKTNGNYTGQAFGGHGSDHGQFQTCHAITWDSRFNQMVVCDRENHRLEYFTVDSTNASVFEYTHTLAFYPLLQRPCNIRVHESDGVAIIPALEGTVGIVNDANDLVSLVNISHALGGLGFLHPHDAHFLPDASGDFILATWNPGRIGYFRRIQQQEYGDSAASST